MRSEMYKLPVKILGHDRLCTHCQKVHNESLGESLFFPDLRVLVFACDCGGEIVVRHFKTDEIPSINNK